MLLNISKTYFINVHVFLYKYNLIKMHGLKSNELSKIG